jgi:hypothetical protein
MKKSLFSALLALTVFLPLSEALAFDPNYIISDDEITDDSAMNLEQIEAFLSHSFLGTYETEDSEGRIRSAAEIIYRAARNNNLNPQFLLVLLQKEQSLITDQDPTQKQLDWATGYAVCDDCSMSDPTLARWRGFGKQVNSAALQFIEGYMADIDAYGKTSGKYGPGITVTIDGTLVTPENAATAALYAYTPHLHGNQNFATLWNTWFGRDYPNGTLMQAPGQDGVWLLEAGYRRPITSKSALASRFDAKLIVPVSKDVLERFPVGKAISLPNYTLVKDENGAISLLVDDSLRHIDSMETFRTIGFSMDEVVEITNEEASAYDVGDEIVGTTVDPQGRLLQLPSGAVFYVENGLRHAIFDRTVLLAKFANMPIVKAESVEVEQYREGQPVRLPDGYLVKTAAEPTVYVIADGERRAIPSESVFTSFGYEWSNIKVVPESVIKLHPVGEPLHDALEDTVGTASVK